MKIATRRIIAAILLLEEEEHLALVHQCLESREKSSVYKRREQEGAFNIFIERHLIDSESRFKAYLRVSRDLFNYILNVIEGSITTNPSYRYPRPIEPVVKLCVTLR